MKIVAEPIDAVVLFKGKDKPIPYKFKYTDCVGERYEVKIGKILSSEERKTAGMRTYIYNCQSVINDIEKRFELKYIIHECRWELYKI